MHRLCLSSAQLCDIIIIPLSAMYIIIPHLCPVRCPLRHRLIPLCMFIRCLSFITYHLAVLLGNFHQIAKKQYLLQLLRSCIGVLYCDIHQLLRHHAAVHHFIEGMNAIAVLYIIDFCRQQFSRRIQLLLQRLPVLAVEHRQIQQAHIIANLYIRHLYFNLVKPPPVLLDRYRHR